MSELKKESKTKKSTKAESKTKKVVKKEASTVKETKAKEKKVKEVKEEKALLSEKDGSAFRVLCKIIKILVQIGKVLLMIFVPFIFLLMILVPIFFKNYEINANIIKFGDVNLIVNNDKLTIKVGNETHVLTYDAKDLDKVTTFLTNNTKGSIITFIELSLLLFAIVMIINIYQLYYLEKLFTNFMTKKTPFIQENTSYIFKIAILMCVLKFIGISLDVVDLSIINVTAYSIVELLIVFVIYLIFKYGVAIQNKVDTKICD